MHTRCQFRETKFLCYWELWFFFCWNLQKMIYTSISRFVFSLNTMRENEMDDTTKKKKKQLMLDLNHFYSFSLTYIVIIQFFILQTMSITSIFFTCTLLWINCVFQIWMNDKTISKCFHLISFLLLFLFSLSVWTRMNMTKKVREREIENKTRMLF